MRTGFIGLGAMGVPMASRLAATGVDVIAWNRSPVTAPEGVRLVDSPRAVAEETDAVVVMVTGPEAVEEVLFGDAGWVGGASAGDTVIQSSTVGPDAMRAIARRLDDEGVQVLDAPVSGSVPVAEQGALTVLGGGDETRFKSFAPVFDAFAKSVLVFGPVGTGSAVKLMVNATLISVVAAGAEALRWLDAREDVDVDTLAGALERISPILAKRLPAVRGEAPEGGFSMKHVAKDLGLMDLHDEELVLRAVAARCRQAMDDGLADHDLAALGAAARRHGP
jgi:3-hydroxyisobutyrate dehydrogenase